MVFVCVACGGGGRGDGASDEGAEVTVAAIPFKGFLFTFLEEAVPVLTVLKLGELGREELVACCLGLWVGGCWLIFFILILFLFDDALLLKGT